MSSDGRSGGRSAGPSRRADGAVRPRNGAPEGYPQRSAPWPPESWIRHLDAAATPFYRPHSAQRRARIGERRPTGATGRPGPEPTGRRETDGRRRRGERSTPGAAPGRPSATTGGCPGPPESSAPDARSGPRRHSPTSTRASSTPGSRALAIDLPDGARGVIDAHVRLLLAWTVAINLTAIRDPAEVARLHVLDSLAAVPHLRRARHRAAAGPRVRRRLSRPPAGGGASARTGRCSWTRSARRSSSCGP